MGPHEAELPGMGASLALSLVSLGVVCLLAWLALRWLARRGPLAGGPDRGLLRVVSRCSLDARRGVAVVEAAGRCFLVGLGDGPVTLLAELDPGEVQAQAMAAGAAERGAGLAALLARAFRTATPAVKPAAMTEPGERRDGVVP